MSVISFCCVRETVQFGVPFGAQFGMQFGLQFGMQVPTVRIVLLQTSSGAER
jgi:hypothetical protein